MATDVFHNGTTSLPTNDSRVVRVPFNKSDLTARPAHMPKNVKNDLNIQHVKAGS